ncbi:hypothetical protein MED121_05493 [Marinomonas sp. MED121]|uniref:hypothetical protein n=1 Tax=Marinomonas sp. MED121 TaxID=314277 RepID=UPI000068FBD2|nr:hypothetical protein [Marinomonas sp. MED121]EAQ63815.1 hypothetical protein MED121_05493 [Marinomonas sp. MED121]
MKAIKLASIFAVSAVAAAVSTTTFAAEPVFSGEAGVSYTVYGDEDENAADTASGTDPAELELAIDTGVVYIEIEMAGDANSDETVNIGLEKAYVTQGAVQFGRFDGTLSDAAALGVNENSGIDIIDTTDTDDTAIRYSITDELTVAIEATEGQDGTDEEAATDTSLAVEASDAIDSEVGVTLSYIADLGAGTFGISGGSVGDANAINVGYSMDVGSTTFAVTYGTGETGAELEEEAVAVSVEMTPTDATTLNIEYTSYESETDGVVDEELDGLYVYASYTAGDLEYYVEHYGKDWGDSTAVGAKASF